MQLRDQYAVTAERSGINPDAALTDFRFRARGAPPVATDRPVARPAGASVALPTSLPPPPPLTVPGGAAASVAITAQTPVADIEAMPVPDLLAAAGLMTPAELAELPDDVFQALMTRAATPAEAP